MSDVILYDSQTAFQGGMQAGVDPAMVAEHQYARGINVSCREGVLDVRPSFDKKNMDTSNLALEEGEYDQAESNYYAGLEALEGLEEITETKEGIYDQALLDYSNRINIARENQIIIDLEVSHGEELSINTLDLFLHRIGFRNHNDTGIMDRAVTILKSFDIDPPLNPPLVPAYEDFWMNPHPVAVVVPKDDCIYTDSELWRNFQVYIEYSWMYYNSYINGDYIAYIKPLIDNVEIVTANEEKELELTESYTAYNLLLAITDGSYEAAYEAAYNDWQEALANEEAQRVVNDQLKNILDSTIDFEEIYNTGKFQGAEIYKTNNQNYIVEVINGHIFMVNLETGKITIATTSDIVLNPLVDRCFFVQAEKYMIVQDGISQPKILEGASIRETDTSIPEIPRGTNMAYGHGRIAIQTSPRHFVMSDIYLAYEPENVLKMKEFGFLNEGGGFTISGRLGNIISLQLAKVADTSTGDGPLLAICENGFASYSINNPRAQWNNIDIAKIQLFGTGLVGNDALCHISEDILYRSHEGIRSYQVGQREAASGYKYTELSKEVEPYIQNDMQYDGRFISMTFFDKRMLSLTAPKGIKARTSGYIYVEIDYEEAKTAALLVERPDDYPDLTDDTVYSEYVARLEYIFDNTTIWIPKVTFAQEIDDAFSVQIAIEGTHLTEDDRPTEQDVQDIIDAQVANISTDPEPDDKICRIENLILWADPEDIGGTYIDDLAAIKAYYDAYLALSGTYVDDTYFKGIISFDFSLAGYTKSTQDSQYNRVTTGSYDGIWTGIKATTLLTTIINGIKRCYVTAKTNDGQNIIYEVTRRQDGFDNVRSKKIECILDTRAMSYKTEQTYVPAPFVYKKLEDLTLWVTQVSEEVNIEIQTSPDVLNSFHKVGELLLKALTETSGDPRTIGAPQSRAMIPLWDLPNDSDPITNKKIRLGNEFMFRITWTGKIRLRRFFTACRKIEQDRQNNIETEEMAYPLDEFNQYRYSSE